MRRTIIIGAVIAAIIAGMAIVSAQSSGSQHNVEMRVWESQTNGKVYWSARAVGGSWRTLGTHEVTFEDGVLGAFRYTDIKVRVPVDGAPPSGATANGVGRKTGRISLSAGLHVCTTEWSNNAYSNGSGGNFISKLIAISGGRGTGMSNGIGVIGKQEKTFRTDGGDYIFEVGTALDSAKWTFGCVKQ